MLDLGDPRDLVVQTHHLSPVALQDLEVPAAQVDLGFLPTVEEHSGAWTHNTPSSPALLSHRHQSQPRTTSTEVINRKEPINLLTRYLDH